MKRILSAVLSLMVLWAAVPLSVAGEEETPPVPAHAYTLIGASWDPADADGEIVLLEDTYAFRFTPGSNRWIGIGDPTGILSSSASVTYEYEILFITQNGNDRCFVSFGDVNGWHAVSEGASQYDEEGVWISGNGFVANGHWGAVPPIGERGSIRLRNDHYDPAVTHHDCITRLGSWVETGELYVFGVKVYDNEDATRFIQLRFNGQESEPDAPYTLEGASWDPETSDGEMVVQDGFHVFRFTHHANTWIGIGDPTGILSGSVSVTYEYEILFVTENLNDRCFVGFGDVNGFHAVSEGAPRYDEEGVWISGNGFVAHGGWGESPPVGQWGTVSIRNDHFDPSATHRGWITCMASWVDTGELYLRSIRVYDNEDESKYILLRFNEDLNELLLTPGYGAEQTEKEGEEAWRISSGGYLQINTQKLLADGTVFPDSVRLAVKLNCWLEETDSQGEVLAVGHFNPDGTGDNEDKSGLCEHWLSHSRLTKRGRWCQYKFLLEDALFTGVEPLRLIYRDGGVLYIRGVEVYEADENGDRVSRRPARWGRVDPDPENLFTWAVNEDGRTLTLTGYIGEGEEVDIPDMFRNKTVTAIGSYAFFGFDHLKRVVIPDTVTTIGDYGFGACTGLAQVEMENGIVSIGVHAFSMCTGLAELTLPDSLVSVGKSAFYGCSGLDRIALPTGLTSLGDMAFAWCEGLKAVTLPDTLTALGQDAFIGCHGDLTLFCCADSAPWQYGQANRISCIPIAQNGVNKMELALAIGEETDLSGCTAARAAAFGQALAAARAVLAEQGAAQPLIDGTLAALIAAKEALTDLAFIGEADGDGVITSTDARLTLQLAVEKISRADLPDAGLLDVDGDGTITSTDARLILEYSVGKLLQWP